MVTMHGLYFLRDPGTEAQFKDAYHAFGGHLVDEGYITTWRLMRRLPHEQYDSRPPTQPYYCALDFPSVKLAQACHDYVEANQDPLRTLHRAVNQLVVRPTTQFYLTEDY